MIFIFSKFGLTAGIESFLQRILSGVAAITYSSFHKLPFISEDSEVKRLKEENANLLEKIVDQKKLTDEIAALRDQFAIQYPKSNNLLYAKVVAATSFIPSVSHPENLILDKGEKDGVRVNQAVVLKNNLIGKIEDVTDNLSKVVLLSDNSLSFTAKTESGGIGIIKGEGNGEITLENVLVADNLRKDEFVYTKGDLDENGFGIAPDLIVGKIVSVEKDPSALFQKAKIQNSIDFKNLLNVFVIINK